MKNIHREPLGSGMEIYVSQSYRFSTDTLLLADFSLPAGKKNCVDLGAGCGTIPLLWLKNNPHLTVAAVEIQEDACALLRDSIAHNHLEERLTVCNADLKALKGLLPFGAFDVVSCNPPYKLGGTGVPSDGRTRTSARWFVRRKNMSLTAASTRPLTRTRWDVGSLPRGGARNGSDGAAWRTSIAFVATSWR